MGTFLESTAGTTAVTVVVALITSGLLLGVLRLPMERRRTGADTNLANANAAGVLTGQALALVQEATAQASSASARAKEAERTARAATKRVRQLEDVIRMMGGEVPPEPEEEDADDDH